MNAFIIATARILKTGTKKPTVGENGRESVVDSEGQISNIRTAYGRCLKSND